MYEINFYQQFLAMLCLSKREQFVLTGKVFQAFDIPPPTEQVWNTPYLFFKSFTGINFYDF